jgi:bis(5'-nucleosyl)-tetraphosphatase (symmetrical)
MTIRTVVTKDKQTKPWHFYYLDKKLVIYGHWSVQGLHRTKNTVGLDSGCVYGKQLSAYCLEEDLIYQINAKKCYADVGS